jgi:membrane protein insertase Oxa1/YidC/SpoIIIJ
MFLRLCIVRAGRGVELAFEHDLQSTQPMKNMRIEKPTIHATKESTKNEIHELKQASMKALKAS